MNLQTRKLTSRQAQAIKTKNKIYHTAYDMMKRKGFDNITIEDISKKAGVSVGAFYHYFKSKNDILFEIYHRADEYFIEHTQGKLAAGHTGDQIVEYLVHYAKFSHQTGLDFSRQLYNTDNKFFIKKDRYMLTALQEIIRQGQAKGEIITEMTPEEITEDLFVAARGVVFDWCLYDGTYDLAERMNIYFMRMVKIYIRS